MDEDEDYSSEEDIEVEEAALADLRSGKLTVKVSEGTFRCPYSPSKKKQAYPYKDLLQHAEGVARGKRGPEAAGKHRALQKYLVTDLANMATPPVERVHKLDLDAPRRNDGEDLFVYPWSGVVYNIDNKERSIAGLSAGPGVSEIRRHFSVFNPDKANVMWGPKGHMGMGVITFRRCSEGLKDALAFEKWFVDRGLSRRDWERRRRGDGLRDELYGWLARKEDYDGRWDSHVAKYLKDTGDLRDVATVGDEVIKIHEERFKSLAETVSEKNEQFRNLETKSEVARRNAEYAMQQREEKHKLELEEVKSKAKRTTEKHTEAMHERNKKLQSSMEALEKRCKAYETALEDKDKHMKTHAESGRLEQEKNQNRLQLAMANEKTNIMQKKHQAGQVKLIKKHEEQNKKVELYVQNLKLRIANQQQSELKLQQLEELIDTEKMEKELVESFTLLDDKQKNMEELEDKLKNMEKQKAEIEEQLQDVKEENETFNDTINNLTTAERTANDELEEARKFAVTALRKHKTGPIKLKRMGEIEDAPWKAACEQRYENHEVGWELVFKEKYSEWEALLSDPNFSPFKNVRIGDEDKWERQVNRDDEKLKALSDDLGKDVCETVVTALLELEDYNASGRYPVPVVWNYERSKRATLKEVIKVLVDVIATLEPKKKRGVKRIRT